MRYKLEHAVVLITVESGMSFLRPSNVFLGALVLPGAHGTAEPLPVRLVCPHLDPFPPTV